MILGLTGGIGSGKSTAAKIFKSLGFKIVDADMECRNVTKRGSEGLARLCLVFGSEILKKNGVLNRKKLAGIAFSDKEKLASLNEIVQKSALELCLNKIEHYTSNGYSVVFDVPLLFECKWDRFCDKTAAVLCDSEIRIQRTMLRDKLPREAVEARIASQMTDEERKKHADYVIYNEKDEEALLKEIAALADILNGHV